MTIETLSGILGWTALINYALLAFWFLMFACAHDWVHRLHGKWFDLPRHTFDALHYGCMAFFKLGNFMLFLVPWIALQIVI